MCIKMEKQTYVENIGIPEGITVLLEGKRLTFTGSKGNVIKKLENPRIKIKIKDNKIELKTNSFSKRDKTMIKTYKAHILNGFKGCLEGFSYKLKICSGHFPMNVSVSNNKIIIKNFLGEKVPRELDMIKDVDVKIDGSFINVEATDKEKAGQMAANIEQKTRRPGFDKRIFQDGIYIVDKAGKKI